MSYNESYEVVIAGGGPAGVAAAVSAARNNAKVLLIERYGFLGGMLTNASVPVFCPFSDGEKPVIQGVGLEILEGLKKEAWKNPFKEEDNGIQGLDWVNTDPEVLKRVLDDIVLESGAEMLFHTNVVGTETENGEVKTILLHSKEGLKKIQAKIFIDCTGDADLVALSDGAFEYGDADGLVQAVTLCFRLAGIDGEKFIAYQKESKETGNLDLAVRCARENGEFPFNEKSVATFVLQSWHMAGVNFGHVYEVNPLKTEDLTRAEIESRKLIPELLKFIKKYVPGAEHAELASTGPFIGVRESRRIIGEYKLTKEDYMNRQLFEDNIARYAYPIDIHASIPSDDALDRSHNQFKNMKYKAGESYGIPYRALLPKELKNIIVAGRTIAADRAMQGSLRVTPACFAMGQAAGTAAAICSQKEILPKEIDILLLQNTLRKQGAYL
ncbi:FAD-dependent oxidoreductase [Cellulosilyticum sp. I15G10I2]|uniref:FAD-dependent oxidoreductase n=1 Tax=Cellulosilyticum sp. I15G10I2 TaxID=1892843 RepID=UPI00085CB469|nr:FAD-dependent oxidoreductase [Cellulosilyticum sp. I15G10I2]